MLIPPTLITVDELGGEAKYTRTHKYTPLQEPQKEMTLTKLIREVSPLHTALNCLSHRKLLYKCVHIITSKVHY